MKKNIIALAVASAIAAPVAMADAPVVFGQVNMALEQVDKKDSAGDKVTASSGTQVNSIASRLGVKGSEDLGDGLKAIYHIEFGLNIDSSGKSSFSQDATTKDATFSNGEAISNRNQFVGLSGGFGTVLMGRHDTPTKMIQGKDFFNDGRGDLGKMADGLGALKNGMENRVSNVLAYVSPSFSGVKLIAALVPSEKSATTKESALGDLYSVAVTYGSAKKGLYLAAGVDEASAKYSSTLNNEKANHMRVVAQYAAGGLIANAMYQDFSGKALETSAKEGSTIGGGIGYKMGKFMPKAQVMMIDREKGFEDSTNYALGLDYSLGKKTTGYVEYVMIDNQGAALDTKAETSSIAVGLLHKF